MTFPASRVIPSRAQVWLDNRADQWMPALKWGLGAALALRVALMAWMALVWLVISRWIDKPADLNNTIERHLPPLNAVEQIIFGVWRRWDATMYLELARHGYTLSDPGPSVFGPLAPLLFRTLDVLLPGPVDLAAMVIETLAFGLGLALLYRLCEVYYGDAALGRRAVLLTVLLPNAYFFLAPQSDGLYYFLSIATFYAAIVRRWTWAGVFGFLATLARQQGAALVGVVGLMLLLEALEFAA